MSLYPSNITGGLSREEVVSQIMEAITWQEYSQVPRTLEQREGKQIRTRPDCHAPIKYKEAAFPEVCPLLFHVVLDAHL